MSFSRVHLAGDPGSALDGGDCGHDRLCDASHSVRLDAFTGIRKFFAEHRKAVLATTIGVVAAASVLLRLGAPALRQLPSEVTAPAPAPSPPPDRQLPPPPPAKPPEHPDTTPPGPGVPDGIGGGT